MPNTITGMTPFGIYGSNGPVSMFPQGVSVGQYGVGMVPQNPSVGPSFGDRLSNFLQTGLGSLAANGLGAVLGTGLNMISQGMQNRQQMKMWQMNNEYNKPINQMARMQEAGINPNLAAAGIAGANQQSVMPQAASMSEAAGVAPDLMSLLGGSVNAAVTNENMAADTRRLDTENIKGAIDIKYNPLLNEETLNNLRIKNKWDEQQFRLAIKVADYYDDITEKNLSKIDKEIEGIVQSITESKEEVKLMQTTEGLNRAQTYSEYKNAELTKARTEFLNKYGDGSPQVLLMDAAIKYGTDSDEYDQAKKVFYDIARAQGEGTYDSDPVKLDLRTSHDAITECENARQNLINGRTELFNQYMRGEITSREYVEADKEMSKQINVLKWSKENAEKAFSRQSYKNGYHDLYIDRTNMVINEAFSLLNTIVGGVAAGYTVGRANRAKPYTERKETRTDYDRKGNATTTYTTTYGNR